MRFQTVDKSYCDYSEIVRDEMIQNRILIIYAQYRNHI